MIVRNTAARQTRRDDRAFTEQWIREYRRVKAELERTGDDASMRTSSAASSGLSASGGPIARNNMSNAVPERQKRQPCGA